MAESLVTHRSASSSPGADINTQASDSASALYEACKNEHEDVVEFLLSQGADANKANKDGLLPLHIASKKGNYRSVRVPPSPYTAQYSRDGQRRHCGAGHLLESVLRAGRPEAVSVKDTLLVEGCIDPHVTTTMLTRAQACVCGPTTAYMASSSSQGLAEVEAMVTSFC